jgi:CheY-like chemotaxis protein
VQTNGSTFHKDAPQGLAQRQRGATDFIQISMLTDTVFVRTRNGALALTGSDVPLSGGFRQLLRLIDGKRNGGEVLRTMGQLDEEDFALWIGELMRQGLIAPKDEELPVDDMAFQLTTELPAGAMGMPSAADNAVIDDIMADVMRDLGAPFATPAAATKKLLRTTARMAVIESAHSKEVVGKAGFFVYPDAAEGLPEMPRTCIAGHVPAQNKVLEIMFLRAGIRPQIVTTRDSLRGILSQPEKPHILVIDAEMPTLDAFRTLEAMRIDAQLQGVRMVILSTRGERAALAEAMMLGAAAYIVKPLRKDVLDAALPQILGRPVTRQ